MNNPLTLSNLFKIEKHQRIFLSEKEIESNRNLKHKSLSTIAETNRLLNFQPFANMNQSNPMEYLYD